MTEPPPYWLMAPFALVAGWHGLTVAEGAVTLFGLAFAGYRDLPVATS